MQLFPTKTSFLLLFILNVSFLQAQVNSPYSRYGLGNIFPSTFTAANGMGGISAAYSSTTNINYLNPSSYADLNTATFDIGMYANFLDLETTTDNLTTGDANLSYIALGFPFLKKLHRQRFGLSFGLIPFSGYQYDIVDSVESDDPQLGTTAYSYKGDGILYQFYEGVGYRFQTDTNTIIKANDTIITGGVFNIGANVAHVFGTLSNITISSFPDEYQSQSTKLTNENKIGGTIFNYGLSYEKQYIRQHKSDRDLLVWRFGASSSPQLNLNGTQSILWTDIKKSGNYELVTDTIYSAPDTSGNIILPSSYRAGVSYSFYTSDEAKNQYTLSAEFDKTQWSSYQGFQDAGNLADNWRIILATEFIPKKGEDKKTPTNYRFGLYSGKSNIVVDGVQLNETGFSLGTGIPIGIGKGAQPTMRNSRINLSLTVGQRGTTDIIKETYFNFGLGLNLNDAQWFQRYKLN